MTKLTQHEIAKLQQHRSQNNHNTHPPTPNGRIPAHLPCGGAGGDSP